MHDAHRVALKSPAKRVHVDRQRVDQRNAVPGCELHDRELGQVSSLAMELGVQRVGLGVGQLVDERIELCLVGDPVEVGHGATLAHHEQPARSPAIGAAWVRLLDPVLAPLEPALHFGVHRARRRTCFFVRDDLGLRPFARRSEG